MDISSKSIKIMKITFPNILKVKIFSIFELWLLKKVFHCFCDALCWLHIYSIFLSKIASDLPARYARLSREAAYCGLASQELGGRDSWLHLQRHQIQRLQPSTQPGACRLWKNTHGWSWSHLRLRWKLSEI